MVMYTMAVKNDGSGRIAKKDVTGLTKARQRETAQEMANELQHNITLELWTAKKLGDGTSTMLLKLFRPEQG